MFIWILPICIIIGIGFFVVKLAAGHESNSITIEVKSEENASDLRIYHCVFKQKENVEERSYIVCNKSAIRIYSHPDVGEVPLMEKKALEAAWRSWDHLKVKRREIDEIKRKLHPDNYRRSA